MKDQLIPFNNELHEQLFAMFILKANSSEQYEKAIGNIEIITSLYINLCVIDYSLLWEDRSLANVEYEG